MFAVDKHQDKDSLIEALLQERDEMYLELSRLFEIDNGALAKAEAIIKKNEEKIKRTEGQVKFQEERIQKLPTS